LHQQVKNKFIQINANKEGAKYCDGFPNLSRDAFTGEETNCDRLYETKQRDFQRWWGKPVSPMQLFPIVLQIRWTGLPTRQSLVEWDAAIKTGFDESRHFRLKRGLRSLKLAECRPGVITFRGKHSCPVKELS